jgi:arylsulfatase A-like enzyme
VVPSNKDSAANSAETEAPGSDDAANAKAGEAKAGEAKTGEANAVEAKAKAGDAKAKAGDAKAKTGEAKTGEAKTGEAKAGETKARGAKADVRAAKAATARRPSRFATAMRWLGPSVVAGATGALAAGLWEGGAMGTLLGAAAAAGFVAMVAWPILFAASAVVRGLWAAWDMRALAVVDDDGGAPRLAGWLGVIWIAALVLAWALFQGTWMLANATAFKPLSLSFAEPMLGVGTLLVLVAFSRPLARALTWLMRKINARWRLTAPRILVSLAIKTLVIGYLVWRLLVKKRIGPVDLSLLHSPLVGLVALALLHATWGRLGKARRVAGPALAVLAAATVVSALYAWRAQPSTTLAIWGDRPIAGLAVDRLFNLDRIRARISLAQFRPVARPDSAHPDIILITIDTVRADHTPPYGGSAEMPLLRDLGTKGAVFDWAFSPSNVTRRSIPSMLTGLAPNRIRGRVVGWALRLDPRHVMLQERMLAGGYETAGFVCCYGFYGDDFRTGWQRGFQKLEIEPTGMKLAKLAREWLTKREATNPQKPLFVWMHILEPHNWQQGTGVPTNDEERRKFYDRALTASDAMIVETLGALTNRRPAQTPIVIITADHGEGLGEHGHPYHSTDLYNSQIHVPLVIAGPGIKAQRITETVSLTDLTPTVLELAGFEAPKGASIDGHSFADLAQGRRLSQPDGGVAFAAMIKDRSNPGGVLAVVRGGWKLINNGDSAELYNVHEDANEKQNLVSVKAGVYNELTLLMQKFTAAEHQSPFD